MITLFVRPVLIDGYPSLLEPAIIAHHGGVLEVLPLAGFGTLAILRSSVERAHREMKPRRDGAG